MTYGVDVYGSIEYGGGQPHANPTAAALGVSPGTFSVVTGNLGGDGSFLVAYTYTQTEAVAQVLHRCEVLDAALATTYYDSGWIAAPSSSFFVPAVTAGIPTDTSGSALAVRVSVQSADGPEFRAVSDPFLFDIQWGIITPSIVTPVDNGSIIFSDNTLVVAWAGNQDSRGNFVDGVRLRLLAGDSDFLYTDTGFMPYAGGLTVSDLVYPLTGGSHYRLGLTLRNPNGVVSPEVFASFWYTVTSEAAVTELDTVGTIYEVALNGQGYMLFDANPDVGADIRSELLRRTRSAQVLQAPRLATSQTPFNEAIERYTFFGASDFRGGSGQANGDRVNGDATAFADSDGINPFEPNRFSLMKATVLSAASAFATCRAVVAGDKAYMHTAASQLKYQADPGGSLTTLNVTKAAATPVTAIVDLASDGQFWYAACGADGILRGTTTDPAAQWSTKTAQMVCWAGQRICCAYPSTGSTPNTFSTLKDDGAEEVVSGRITLPPGWTISDVTSGDGFVWFTAYSGSKGAVYKWDMTAAVPSSAWETPYGEQPVAIEWYQGEVFIRTKVLTATTPTDQARIYQAGNSSGNLVPVLLCELKTANPGAGTFGVNERNVFFSWGDHGDGKVGLGAIDLTTAGYCRWLKGPTSAGPIRSIFEWRGRTFFTVDGSGLYAEHATNYVTTGYLRSSLHDGASGVDKVFDRLMMQFLPLPTGGEVDLKATYDGGNSYATVAGWGALTAGQTSAIVDLGRRALSAGVEITLKAPGTPTTTPVVLVWQLQCHPTGKADLLLQLPIDCGDRVSDLNGRQLPENGDGAGSRRARLLENLMAQRVAVQDVDWADTGITEMFEVDKVERIPIPGVVKEKQPGVARLKEVVLLTLRKSQK